jgi:DNA-binding FadR family transcriptional regulator
MSPFQNSEFLHYLLRAARTREDNWRLPPLNELSDELGVSVARLREQLEVARTLGFVEARPRLGIRRLPYSFLPAIRSSLLYAIELDPTNFDFFNNLRNHLEADYYHEAVRLLQPEDFEELKLLVKQAFNKLRGPNIHIPHEEHRRLHLELFKRLPDPFVVGLLEAYWEAYEAAGLNQYADYQYLQELWEYHQRMVDAIAAGDIEAGYQALVGHARLPAERYQAPGKGNNDGMTYSDSDTNHASYADPA